MDIFLMTALVAVGVYFVVKKEERRRILLLGSHLGQYQIEKLMETVAGGYQRALEAADQQRREQIWQQMGSHEVKLSEQFNDFASTFAKSGEPDTRVSRLPLALPYADKVLPAVTFDMRKAMAIHARGIASAVRNSAARSAKGRAFSISAELFLMQHTCHWFCKSRAVASARVMVRHQTSYKQLLDAVSPETRQAYSELVGI